MKIIRTLIDIMKVSIVMIMPFLLLAVLEKITENISGETVVQAMIAGSIIIALYIKTKYLKGGE